MTTTHEPDRVQELEAKVAELTAMVERLTPAAVPAVEEEETPRASRRGMLKLAGAVAAGAAATVVAKGGQVAALDGDNLKAANFISTTAANKESTGLVYTNTSGGPTVTQGIFPFTSEVAANIFTVRDAPGGIIFLGTNYNASDYPAAVGGFAFNTVANGVYGKSNGTGYGVVGEGTGSTTTGVLAKGTKSNLLLYAAGVSGPKRTDAHVKGEVIVDSDGSAWICVVDGTPGTWRKLAGASTAGSFHAITPTRVYDSRAAQPSTGALSAGGTRTLSMKDGRNLDTGAVTTTDLIPSGATAVTANVTVVNTVGAGFLAVNPGGNTTVSAATINWFGAGQILNNGVTLTLNAAREVTVIAGGGTTDFVIDVTGYFL